VAYPPHLLDELARVFARVALDRLLKESAERQPRQEDTSASPASDVPAGESRVADNESRG
jgi:hypothetical protein